ncbi:hypothetical protein [Jidongwangia harbinensis]|uniref:hypothetical protein n=1 Tax=Jidongwangia harbinensis TaxID=2878561 RepID=UPI001CD9F8BC|nr:hypothetical protein [Jidongwangia harbinensis]MCA2213705.1 hypothetical protein [Jidongwangia harbinensis]
MLLEGPAIEPLLAQVREEYGSGVRIISADKVRSGGFGGFFAKQHYELSVEVPDPSDDRKNMTQRKTATTTAPARDAGPHTLEQLLERAESHDRIVADEPSPFERPVERDVPVAPGRPAAGDRKAGRNAGMDDAEAAHRRDLSDTGAAFAELMSGLDAAHHIATSAGVRPSPRPKAGGDGEETPAVRPFRPATTSETPVNSNAVKPLPPVPSLAELMGGLGVSPSEVPPFEAAKPAPTPARSAAHAYGLTPPAAPPAAAPPAAAPPAAPPPAPENPPAAVRPVHADPVIRNLISVGMPEEMATKITGGDTYAGVLAALAARPSAPGVPDAPGEILVLAGDLTHAVPIGRHLLEQAGIDQTHLLLAGPSAAGTGIHSSRVIASPAVAAERADKLHGSEAAWVVVLDAPVGSTDPIWVADMCDAIGATALWAVVDATRKTADTARYLRSLGEVEALVVHNIELTSDPATVLGLDLPIYSMDGKPATPHAWAAMLCARIAADVTPPAAPPRRQARAAR